MILGGAKISDKINVTKALAEKADYLLICGAMAFTFLKATGFNIGSSKWELDETFFCLNLISDYPDKIILPIDIVTALEIDKKAKTKVRFVNEIKEDENFKYALCAVGSVKQCIILENKTAVQVPELIDNHVVATLK